MYTIDLSDTHLTEIVRNIANTFVHYGLGTGKSSPIRKERVTTLAEVVYHVLQQANVTGFCNFLLINEVDRAREALISIWSGNNKPLIINKLLPLLAHLPDNRNMKESLK